MYLRLGHIVGRSGILWATGIILASTTITFLTSLSLSAISTNTRVRGGGAYYLISRSLGVEFGGAIGIVFYLAQAASVAMYVIGFAEALMATFPFPPGSAIYVGTVVNGAVFACVYVGAGWTIRVQYGILAILGLSLVSFFAGVLPSVDLGVAHENFLSRFDSSEDLYAMFALFFPAVTGIMAGANMSGDLRDPARSIPAGTLAAIGVTLVVYIAMAVALGCVRPADSLLADTMVVRDIALFPGLITAGVFAATLSSALGSMMGAPRILQAFARDNVFRSLRVFGRGSGTRNEPRTAIILTWAISEACILGGDLDTVAPVITMSFMLTYGTLNLATFYEAVTRNPSYRPRFAYCHWSTSLAGALGCVAVMFLIAPLWASVSIASMAAIHWYIKSRELTARWGDLHSGLLFERVRRNLLKLEEEENHPKNWRPVVIALSGEAWSRLYLAVYGHWFAGGTGVLSLGQVIEGEMDNRLERRVNQEKILRDFIREEELLAFPAVVVAPNLAEGIASLVQCHGIGLVRPNTVLLGWPQDPDRLTPLWSTLNTLAQLHLNIVCLHFRDDTSDAWVPPSGPIDVWWRGHENGELMLLLAYLLTRNDEWRGRSIRLLRVIQNRAGESEVTSHLNGLIRAARIRATALVTVADDVSDAITTVSQDAALVFLGFQVPDKGEELDFYRRMELLTHGLARVVLVDSAGGMALES
ncbi:MAG: amino acid permease [Candidatus Hydrogenedentes bacterium]|nr:amino acid permease [Candidatus Hydrogenedentota bacterium]